MGDTSTAVEGLVLTEPGVSVEIAGVTVSADTVVSADPDRAICASTGCRPGS